jgi:Txe/YoeB family toxin of Txe-Axe toxin-antitoxin module
MQCYFINNKIALEVYTGIKNILEDIKNDPKENYISEEKIVSDFSNKYDMHFLTFEQEILPKVKSLVFQERRVKIFQFNELNFWRLRV